eukprot:COSAG02_NODE_10234_length_1990_cov_1.242200_1_plen_171_part_00
MHVGNWSVCLDEKCMGARARSPFKIHGLIEMSTDVHEKEDPTSWLGHANARFGKEVKCQKTRIDFLKKVKNEEPQPKVICQSGHFILWEIKWSVSKTLDKTLGGRAGKRFPRGKQLTNPRPIPDTEPNSLRVTPRHLRTRRALLEFQKPILCFRPRPIRRCIVVREQTNT